MGFLCQSNDSNVSKTPFKKFERSARVQREYYGVVMTTVYEFCPSYHYVKVMGENKCYAFDDRVPRTFTLSLYLNRGFPKC